jgi:hypothetical protein
MSVNADASGANADSANADSANADANAGTPEITDDANAGAPEITDDDRAGIADLHKLTMAMAMPVVRGLLHQAVREAPDSAGSLDRDHAREVVQGMYPAADGGCVNVVFARPDGTEVTGYVTVGLCDRDHDTDRQLDALRAVASESQWPVVVTNLAAQFRLVRDVFAKVCAEHPDLVAALEVSDALELRMDPANSTLFMRPEWPKRAGLHTRMGAEQPAPV